MGAGLTTQINHNPQTVSAKPQINFQKSLNHDKIQVIMMTWKNSQHNIFNYSQNPPDIHKQTIQFIPDCRIAKGDTIELLQPKAQPLKNYKLLMEFNKVKQRIIFTNYQGKILVPVHFLPKKQYILNQTDTFVVGNQKLKVKEIVLLENGSPNQLHDNNILTQFSVYVQTNKDVFEGQRNNGEECKVCLEEGKVYNPLISACNCCGSAKFIHLSCLRKWLTQLMNPHTSNRAVIITWKPLSCQFCKKSLPFKVQLSGKKYFTVLIPLPKKPYILLNHVQKLPKPSNQQKKRSKIYYIISFYENNELIIGRHDKCGLILSDNSSISRNHSCLKFCPDSQKVSISDYKSKYGTLILLKRNKFILPNRQSIHLQLSGVFMSINRDYPVDGQEWNLKQQYDEEEADKDPLSDNQFHDYDH